MFYKKFIKICNEKGVTPSSVGTNVGISKAAVSGWKKGSLPRDTQLEKLADYFGVPVSYFSEDAPEAEKSPMRDGIEDLGEEALLRYYRALSPEDQARVRELLFKMVLEDKK